MDVVIPRKDILRLAERCAGVVDPKASMPILANIKLDARTGALHAAATDLYLGMSCQTACEISEDGSVAVPCRDLVDRLKLHENGPLRIRSIDGNTRVEISAIGKKRVHRLSAIPAIDFPQLPTIPGDAASFEMPARELSRMIAHVAYAINDDPANKKGNCLIVEMSPKSMTLAGTDGNRISIIESSKEYGVTQSIMIPLKGVNELRRLIDSTRSDVDSTNIRVTCLDSTVFFEVAGIRFSTKLSSETAPQFRAIIPKSSACKATVLRAAFTDSIRSVYAASAGGQGVVKVTIANGIMRLDAKEAAGGEASDELAIEGEGETVCNFFGKFLLGALGALECDTISIGMGGDLDPMTITPASQLENENIIAVIAPTRP